MSNADISKWDSESMKIFAELSDQEKQAVSALLQISQLNNTDNTLEVPQRCEQASALRQILTMPSPVDNTENSDSDSPLVVDDDPPNSLSFSPPAFSTRDDSLTTKKQILNGTETLNVCFNTIQLDDRDKTTKMPAVSPDSSRLSPRVNSACSEEISEAFQGQFLETLRTKNDGSARRPMNAYMLFCKVNRTQVKEKNQGLSNREISQILGKMWHDLDKEEWQKYTNMSFELRKAHYVAYPDFKWSKKQKRPASFPSKRVQTQEEDMLRPKSSMFPSINYTDQNFLPFTFKPLCFDPNKERRLLHPSSLHSVNMQSQLPGVSPFLSDSLTKSQDISPSKYNQTFSDDLMPMKKMKITTPIPGLPSEQLFQHYLIPNVVSTLPTLFQSQLHPGIHQTISAVSPSHYLSDQRANLLGMAIPMYHTGAGLSGTGIQFVSTDPNSHYYTIQQGSLLNGKLINDS